MPSPYTPGGSSSTPYRPAPSPISTSTSSDIPNAGKVAFGITDPGHGLIQSVGNLNAGFIGVGKGLVSIAENLPVIGGIAKPLIGFIGSIADNTIGRGVSLLEGIKIGDSNLAQAAVHGLEVAGTPLAVGLNLLGAPSRFVEQKVAEARIISTRKGQNDWITSVFGDAPSSALQAINGGATIEQAANNLAESNSGFSADGAHNFLWSLILDPVNLIAPAVGKFSKLGATASEFAKIYKSGFARPIEEARRLGDAKLLEDLQKAQKFSEDWGWAGKVYDATMGNLKQFTKKFASVPAAQAARALHVVHDSGVASDAMDRIVLLTGGTREVAERGLRNFAVTAANAAKSGMVRVVAAIRRTNSESFAKSAVAYLDDTIRKVRDGVEGAKSAAEILAQKIEGTDLSLSQVMEKSGFGLEDQQKLLATIESEVAAGTRPDQLLRNPEIISLRDKLGSGHANWMVTERAPAMKAIASFRQTLDSRMAYEEAYRVLLQNKSERLASAQSIITDGVASKGRTELIQDMIGGFGMKEADAIAYADWAIAKYGKDIRKMQDVLSIARGANYGQAVRSLAAVRSRLTDKFKNLTIISGRSITEREIKVIKAEITSLRGRLATAADDVESAAIKEEMKKLSDGLIDKYDDLSTRFIKGKDTYEDVFRFVEKTEGLAVRELTSDEMTQIIELAKKSGDHAAVVALKNTLEAQGYKLGMAPESGAIRANVLKSAADGTESWQDVLLPFADTIDTEAVQAIDALAANKLRPTAMDGIVDKFTRAYGPELTRTNYAERFVTSVVQKSGISVNRARKILAEINSYAAERNLRPQALFLDKRQIEDIFVANGNMTRAEFSKLLDSGSEPIKEILSAAAGDFSVAGLTSGATGRVKAVFPAITVLTDIIYPNVKFGRINPYFNLVLERFETKFQLFVYNIRKELADIVDEEVRGATLSRGYRAQSNVNREFADGAILVSRRLAHNTVTALESAPTWRNRVANRIRVFKSTALSTDDVRIVKEAARDMMADRFASREVIDLIHQAAPKALEELAVHYGVTKAEDVVQLLLEEYMMHSDPALLARHIARNGGIARGLASNSMKAKIAESYMATRGMSAADAAIAAEKTANDLANVVIGAYEVAIERGARLADKAQYFSNYRTWFERSINHPFLALYPYSYMVQKAIPSMMRIMFLTPGPRGIVLPAWGYVNWMKVMEYADNRMNSDQDVLDQLLQNDALIWAVSNIFPATPNNMGFSFSATARKGLMQPGLRGTALTPGELAPALTETGSTLVRASAVGQARNLLEGLQGFQDSSNINANIQQGIQQFSQNLQPELVKRIEEIRNP